MSHSDHLVLQTAGVNDVWHYNEIHLDSQARDAGTNDEPVFNLPVPLHDVMGFKVLSAQIPFSYYLVNDHNNTCNFYFFQDYGTIGGHQVIPATLTIPTGNYSDPDALGAAWQKEMNQAALEMPLVTPFTFAVEFHANVGTFEVYAKNKDNERISEANNGAATTDGTLTLYHGISFSFPSGARGESCASLFGCRPDTFYGRIDPDVDPDPNKTTNRDFLYTVPTGLVNITGSNYLTLFSNLGNRLSNNLLVNGATTSSPPIIARIPVDVEPFQVIEYLDPNPSFFFDTTLSQIQSLQFSLRLGRAETHALQLNDQPWSVVLMVLTQRETTAARNVYPSESNLAKRIRVR